MVHVSKMSTEFVKDPNDVVKIGQKVKVRVVEVDEQGRINLSMLFGADAENKERSRSESLDRRPQEVRARGIRGFDRASRPSEHPLSMQLRRERGNDWRSRGDNRKPPYRKPY